MSIEALKTYCSKIVAFSKTELSILGDYFSEVKLRKKDFLLAHGQICDFIAFLTDGCIRHYHIKEGEEITCDISFENSFLTEFNSFNQETKSEIVFQALENSRLFVIEKKRLLELYQAHPKFEELGRRIAENVAIRNTAIAMSLASEKPEKRYDNLLREKPEIFQRIPQKHIANILGIKPESLSRIRKRTLSGPKS